MMPYILITLRFYDAKNKQDAPAAQEKNNKYRLREINMVEREYDIQFQFYVIYKT